MLSEHEENLLDGILAQLEEHFPNYAVAVLSEDEEFLHSDYSSWRIGRMLFRDSLEDMDRSMNFDEWGDDGDWSDIPDEWENEDDE